MTDQSELDDLLETVQQCDDSIKYFKRLKGECSARVQEILNKGETHGITKGTKGSKLRS